MKLRAHSELHGVTDRHIAQFTVIAAKTSNFNKSGVFLRVDVTLTAVTRCHSCCISSCCSTVVPRHLVAEIEIMTQLETFTSNCFFSRYVPNVLCDIVRRRWNLFLITLYFHNFHWILIRRIIYIRKSNETVIKMFSYDPSIVKTAICGYPLRIDCSNFDRNEILNYNTN